MPVPVISVAQMREWEEASWTAGILERDVIAKAGKAVSERAAKMTKPKDKVIVLVGKGHNGDDARVAGSHLGDRDVRMIMFTNHDAVHQQFLSHLSAGPTLIIDGFFGIGLNRPLEPDWIRFLEQVNHSGVPILSVDVPSGLNADTGETFGAALRASTTVTLGAPKKGLLTPQAGPYVGRLEVAHQIGLGQHPLFGDFLWTLPEDFIGYPPPRIAFTHKGDYGHAVIFAGSTGFHGAAILAARGALRARPGLVSLFTPEDVYVPVASQLQSAMVHPWRTNTVVPPKATCILLGPGLASKDFPEDLKKMAQTLWMEAPIPVVADASALDWLPTTPPPQDMERVITPHPGEAARMLGKSIEEIEANRAATALELSAKWHNCWAVYKGHQSVVANSGIGVLFNPTGNPFLAQGGSGDVLAGYLTGLLAQPGLQDNPFQAVRYAVWQHGATADYLQETCPNWTIEELLEKLGSVKP